MLGGFADELEGAKDFKSALAALIINTFRAHKRIVFNGNNYAAAWVAEANKRGLSNLKTTTDALPAFISPKSITLFTKNHVFSKTEVNSRYEILTKSYKKTLNIEALTMLDIAKGSIISSCIAYQNELSSLIVSKKTCGDYSAALEEYLLKSISGLSASLLKSLSALEDAVLKAEEIKDSTAQAAAYGNSVIAAMNELRIAVDGLETLIAKKHWPLPCYAELFFNII